SAMLRSTLWSVRLISNSARVPFQEAISSSSIHVFDPAQRLFTTPVEMTARNGEKFNIDAVFQDTLPSGSSRGTVVTMHGSPGSHKDFKYITPILEEKGLRVVGVNFGGFGLSSDSRHLRQTNVERSEFVEGLLDRLNLNENVLFLAHSRGCETALRLSVRNQDKCIGMALINPAGFSVHRAIRPLTAVKLLRRAIDRYPVMHPAMEKIAYHFYHRILRLRLSHGRVAFAAIKSMSMSDLWRQRELVEAINKNEDIRTLICYSGKDHLIDTWISKEFTAAFEKRLALSLHKNESEEELTEQIVKAFNDDQRRVTVEFRDDNHFAQKKRAKLIAASVDSMFNSLDKK
ncbi:hypothetical protein PMAYCL1PPCAC_03753, partial [Pristionchus mayeri]